MTFVFLVPRPRGLYARAVDVGVSGSVTEKGHMDAVTGDVASILGLLSTLYVTVVLIRRIFLQRTAWMAGEADIVVTAELLNRYDDVLDRFMEVPQRRRVSSSVSALTESGGEEEEEEEDGEGTDDAATPGLDPQRRATSRRALLCVPPPAPVAVAVAVAESDGMRLAPGRSPARISRWSLPPSTGALQPRPSCCTEAPVIGTARFDDRPFSADGSAAPVAGGAQQPRPSCCTEAPAIGTARFDDHPFNDDWTDAVRRNVHRFTSVAGRPLLDAAARAAVEDAAAVALRTRLPLCSKAEARQHVAAAYARVSQRLGARLRTDYFRFCAVATRIAG
jgi:hypothetical protein